MIFHLVIDSSLQRSQVLIQASQRLQDEGQIFDFSWAQDTLGRPLPDQWRYWSLSHSAHGWLVGLAQQPIGVDVQHMSPRSPAIWQQVMTEYADCFVDMSKLLDDREQFFCVWTATEAMLKHYGLWLDQRDQIRLSDLRQEDRSVDGLHGHRLIQGQRWAHSHQICVWMVGQYCYALTFSCTSSQNLTKIWQI